MEPARFDEMRPGCWDIDARVADMDVGGVWASLCFPSLIAGFAGDVFSRRKDPELGLACVRAWNDWHLEVWAGPTPGASSRCSSRGCTTRRSPPPRSGATPSAASRPSASPRTRSTSACRRCTPSHWDPFLAACEETGTVVCLHTGSAALDVAASPGRSAARAVHDAVPGERAASAAADWLWAGVRCGSPAAHRVLRGWHRLGADAAGPARLGARPLGVRAGDGVWHGRPHARARCCAATSGSAPSTTRRRWQPARPHRRRPHPRRERLPARRLDVARHADAARRRASPPSAATDDEAAAVTGRNARHPFRWRREPADATARSSAMARPR